MHELFPPPPNPANSPILSLLQPVTLLSTMELGISEIFRHNRVHLRRSTGKPRCLDQLKNNNLQPLLGALFFAIKQLAFILLHKGNLRQEITHVMGPLQVAEGLKLEAGEVITGQALINLCWPSAFHTLLTASIIALIHLRAKTFIDSIKNTSPQTPRRKPATC